MISPRYIVVIFFFYFSDLSGQADLLLSDKYYLNKKLEYSKIQMDTSVYASLFNWYLNHKSKKASNNYYNYIFIPLLKINEDCFINLNCNYYDNTFYNCVEPETDPHLISAFYSLDNISWGYIEFTSKDWYVVEDSILMGFHKSLIKKLSVEDLHKDLGKDAFLLEGKFCKIINNSIRVYTGGGQYSDFVELFGENKLISIRLNDLCK